MKLRLPGYSDYRTEFHVGEETYLLKFVSRMPAVGKGAVGLCDPESRTIYVKKGLSKSMLFRTVTHELLHAIEFEMDLNVPHKLIYQFEKAIVDTLLMNF